MSSPGNDAPPASPTIARSSMPAQNAARPAGVGVEAHRHQSQGHARTLETTQDRRHTVFEQRRQVGVVRRQGEVDTQSLIAGERNRSAS